MLHILLNEYGVQVMFIRNYATSTKHIPRLSSEERKNVKLNPQLIEILPGIILSDGHIAQRSLTSNCRFIFTQSGKNIEYF